MTQIIITFSHAKFAASKPTSNGGKKPTIFPAIIKPMKQKLTKSRFVQCLCFIITDTKLQAIAGSANDDSEKSFIYLNTYRV